MAGPKHPRHYDEAFKRQIVQSCESGKPSREIRAEYDIARSTLQRWVQGIRNSGSIPKCERIDCNKRFPFLVVKASLIPVLKSCASRCATFDSSRLKPICKTALDSFHEAMPTAVCFGFSYGNISDTLIQAEGSSLRRLK